MNTFVNSWQHCYVNSMSKRGNEKFGLPLCPSDKNKTLTTPIETRGSLVWDSASFMLSQYLSR